MDDDLRGILGKEGVTNEEILRAMRLATTEALRAHKRAGHSVVMWDREHDRIVVVPPEEIEVPKAGPEPVAGGVEGPSRA